MTMFSLSSPKSHVSRSSTISESFSRIWSTIHSVLFHTYIALTIAPDRDDLGFVETTTKAMICMSLNSQNVVSKCEDMTI